MVDINPYLSVTTIIEYTVKVNPQNLDRDDLSQIIQSTPQSFSIDNIVDQDEIDVPKVATGFFYSPSEESGEYYLITCKHVVEPEDTNSPEELVIKRRIADAGEFQIEDYVIPLQSNGNRLWKSHPENPSADIAAIPLDYDVKNYSNVVEQGLIKPVIDREQITDFDVGYDCTVIGYPIGFRDTSTELPVVRKALISTPIDIPFRGQLAFLTDGKMHGGMSGSPVFEAFPPKLNPGNGISYSPPNPRLLGVHSGTWLPDEDLQLNSVWRSTLIPEIVATF